MGIRKLQIYSLKYIHCRCNDIEDTKVNLQEQFGVKCILHRKAKCRQTQLVMGPICTINFTTNLSFKVQWVCWFFMKWFNVKTIMLTVNYTSRRRFFLHFVLWIQFATSTADSTLATNNTGCCQQKERRCHQQQDSKPSEDSNHLCSMPDNWCSRMTKFVLTWTFVVMSKKEVILKYKQNEK